MKILLLGYKGNLGSSLCKIAGDQHELVKWESSDFDLEDLEALKKKIRKTKPDVLINTMAYNAVDNCEIDDLECKKAMLLNIELPKALAAVCLEEGIALVHYSTDYVFGGYSESELLTYRNNEGFTEKNEPKPNSRYSETKYRGEEELLKHLADGLKIYLIRTSKLFGEKGDSEFAKPSFFDTMLRLAEKSQELKVVDEEKSCFTYTKDLANATMDLIEGDYEYGVYHIVNEGACTWYEGAKTLFALAEKNVKIIPVSSKEFPRPANRPVYSVLKNTKLKKLRSYEEALRDYLKI